MTIIERHYYSVPYRFAREPIEARITARTIELFHQGERVAAHMRGSGNGRHTTIWEHMPSSHRGFADWSERIARDAAAVGPCTALLCEKILEERPHPEQGFRACLGIMRLVRGFGRERLEAACGRALDIGARTYGSVRSILDNRLDQMRAATGAGRSGHLPPQHPGLPLLPLKETMMLQHPTLHRLNAMGLAGMARAFGELATNAEAERLTHPEWLALLLDREWSFRHDRKLAACGSPSCATRPRPRMSTIAAVAVSTTRCSSSSSPATGSPPTTIW